MEFGLSTEDCEFRADLVTFLEEELGGAWERGAASLGSTVFTDGHTTEFAHRLGQHGYLTPHWPAEHGGRDASAWQHFALGEEMWARGEPRGPLYMAVNWAGPTIMQYGTDEQKRFFLPRIARGELFFCQGFSEPDAGSDLASLRTRATRDGDGYRINGQKIWTSYARTADYIFLLARTGRLEDRGRAISIFLVDMKSPGVEVRPIESFIGDHSFHEVFFSDVYVTAATRLGQENEGWPIVRHALANERVGAPRYARAAAVVDLVAEVLHSRGLLDDPVVQVRLASSHAACEAARVLCYAAVDERAKGRPPSAIVALARAAQINAERSVGSLANEMIPDALARGSAGDGPFRNSLTVGIAGGSHEVQLDQISRQILQLPKA